MKIKHVLSVILALCSVASGRALAAKPVPPEQKQASGEGAKSPLLAAALAGPLGHVDEIVFAVRLTYEDPHWYANIGYYCDDEHHKAYAGNGKPDAGKLCN